MQGLPVSGSLALLIIVWSLVVYRVARFVILDELIAEPRDWVMDRLERAKPDRLVPAWKQKLAILLGCPYCVTPWIAAATLVAHRLFVGSFAIPVWCWLAVAAGAVIVYRYVDTEDD
jgi:hypothetical protein